MVVLLVSVGWVYCSGVDSPSYFFFFFIVFGVKRRAPRPGVCEEHGWDVAGRENQRCGLAVAPAGGVDVTWHRRPLLVPVGQGERFLASLFVRNDAGMCVETAECLDEACHPIGGERHLHTSLCPFFVWSHQVHVLNRATVAILHRSGRAFLVVSGVTVLEAPSLMLWGGGPIGMRRWTMELLMASLAYLTAGSPQQVRTKKGV